MRNKLDEISRAHEELENLMGATEIGTLFLDRELRIQRFTAGANNIINIMPGIGPAYRPPDPQDEIQQLTEDAEQVLRSLLPVEHEVQTENDDWYLLRLRPYRTTDDRIQGVVMSFIDIKKLKQAEQEIVHAKETLEERVSERTPRTGRSEPESPPGPQPFFGLFNANPIPTRLSGWRIRSS